MPKIDGALARSDAPGNEISNCPFVGTGTPRETMYRPDYFPSNANAAPHMVLEELANSLREEPMIWQHPDRLLDVVTALPSVLRAFERQAGSN
jgi:hypothetical protein